MIVLVVKGFTTIYHQHVIFAIFLIFMVLALVVLVRIRGYAHSADKEATLADYLSFFGCSSSGTRMATLSPSSNGF
jgi:hypothetical protein